MHRQFVEARDSLSSDTTFKMEEQTKNWDIVRHNKTVLRDVYGVDADRLSENLVSKGVFSPIEEGTISRIPVNLLNDRFDKIFTILYAKDPKKYLPLFIEALQNTQEGAATFLRGRIYPGSIPTQQPPPSTTSIETKSSRIIFKMEEQTKNWDIVRHNKTVLRDVYGVDADRLSENLVSKGVFSTIEERTISRIPVNLLNDRFDQIFTILYAKDPRRYLPLFIEALQDTQEDAATFLRETTSGTESNAHIQMLLNTLQFLANFPGSNLESSASVAIQNGEVIRLCRKHRAATEFLQAKKYQQNAFYVV
ncbi:unnamed protein product [Darwinula stevensoni]|uniref:CARD domain-containing protein n=1 Tax=Darwinula stevensoni TaxID=69355 RepID=A0A7R9ABF4_9CRUS|nr:unnamed protein product [Darwinula stevensoni]CAG0899352.1 unnamed protein product [Darwinula stevensoni]